MPKSKSPKTPTIPVNLRLPAELMIRVDKLATDLNTTRTFVLTMMLSASLEVVEKVLNPAQWFNDPAVINIIEQRIKGGLFDGQEESEQSTKAKA